jgi:hypothetical protein
VLLPAGASVAYTATCTLAGSATGTLSNTATVAAPASTVDPPGNNAAIDLDLVTPEADLSIAKDDGVVYAPPESSLTYVLVVGNAGPSAAEGAVVSDLLPSALTCDWTCEGAGGGDCPASGAGDLAVEVDLPAGGSATFTMECTVAGDATGLLTNTASVTAPVGVSDPAPGNNVATDVDTTDPLLFTSGFETGDTSEWSGQEPAGLVGAGVAGERVALRGARGTRFAYDLGTLPARELPPVRLATAVDAAGRVRYAVQARRVAVGAPLELRLVAHAGAGAVASDWVEVEQRRAELRLVWRPAEGDGQDGVVALAVGGRLVLRLEGVTAMPEEPEGLRLHRVRAPGRAERR